MTESLPFLLSAAAARTLIVLAALLLGIRVFGKRQFGGMNVNDLVLVLALANAVQNALTKGSGNLGVGLVSAIVLLLSGRLLASLFVRRPAWESRLVGNPTIVVQDGQYVSKRMRREGLTEAEVLAAAHQSGLAGIEEVKLAILEVDGSLSIVPRD